MESDSTESLIDTQNLSDIDCLTELAAVSICTSLSQWRDDDNLEMAFSSLADYFARLPDNLRDFVLEVLSSIEDPAPEAKHFAVFIYETTRCLSLCCAGENFDFEYLLDLCGIKLQNLKSLELPEGLELSNEVCEKMCEQMPNLTNLCMRDCNVMDSAMKDIAKLPLKEFTAPKTISDEGIKLLCDKDSKLRKTLHTISTELDFSIETFHLVLNSMPLLEEPMLKNSQWLHRLPLDMRLKTYNLNKLLINSTSDNVREELEIAVFSFPKMNVLTVEFDFFTDVKLIYLLTMFQQLTVLRVKVRPFLETNFRNGLTLDYLSGLYFPALTKLYFQDSEDGWTSHGYLFTVLEMCPKLEVLQLHNCMGFSNKCATELVYLMLNLKLKTLIVTYCYLLDDSGVEELLKIHSLKYLIAAFKQRFDDETREELFSVAKHYGVCLKLDDGGEEDIMQNEVELGEE